MPLFEALSATSDAHAHVENAKNAAPSILANVVSLFRAIFKR